MTSLIVLWCLSFRYRVRPRSAHQHAVGAPAHVVVVSGAEDWHCRDCARSSSHSAAMTGPDWARSVVILAVAAVLIGASAMLTGRLL